MGDMSREPSMEDILSSIRRVIARDEAPGAPRDGRAAEAEDILDLQDQEDRAAASPVMVRTPRLVSSMPRAASAPTFRIFIGDLSRLERPKATGLTHGYGRPGKRV